MTPLWYIALRDWLCEKIGHLPEKTWEYNGYLHSQCRICRRTQSKPSSCTQGAQ